MTITMFSILIYLIICTFTDLKKRSISLIISTVFILAGLILCILGYSPHDNFISLLLSLLPGGVLLLLSVVTKEAIGYGDGLMLITMGFYLSHPENLSILLYSLIIAGIFSLFLLTLGKYQRKYKIPFSPFLLLGYLIYFMLFYYFC